MGSLRLPTESPMVMTRSRDQISFTNSRITTTEVLDHALFHLMILTLSPREAHFFVYPLSDFVLFCRCVRRARGGGGRGYPPNGEPPTPLFFQWYHQLCRVDTYPAL